MKTFYDIARDRWPDRHISGGGSIAVIPLDDKSCRLFVTMVEAEQIIVNPMRVMVCDLAERSTPCPDLPDDWEDRQRARKEARDRQR